MKASTKHNNEQTTFSRQAFPDSARLAIQGLTTAILDAVRAKGGTDTDELETRLRIALLGVYRQAEAAQSRYSLDTVAAGIDEMSLLNEAGTALLKNVSETGSPFLIVTPKGVRNYALQMVVRYRILNLVRECNRAEDSAREAYRQQELGGSVHRPKAASMSTLREYLLEAVSRTLQDVAEELKISRCEVRRPLYRVLPEVIESLTGIQGATAPVLLGTFATSGRINATGIRLLNDPEFRDIVGNALARHIAGIKANAAAERRQRMEHAPETCDETTDNGCGEEAPTANDAGRRTRTPARNLSAGAMMRAA